MASRNGNGESWREVQSYPSAGKQATLYSAAQPGAPLVVLNTYTGNGASTVEAMREVGCADCNLLVVGELAWDHDMTPWWCPPLTEDDTPCTGGAEDYLGALMGQVIPEALTHIDGTPAYQAIAGYSLAGLFAVWAAYNTDAFARVASMSGSLWFPRFVEYATGREMARVPDRMYLSLGDAEARSRNRLLRTVRDNTEALVAHWRGLGIDLTWELNPGNHFRDAALRSAKGISAVVA